MEDVVPAVIFGFLFLLGAAGTLNVYGLADFIAKAHREEGWGTDGWRAKTTTGVRLTGITFVIPSAIVLITIAT